MDQLNIASSLFPENFKDNLLFYSCISYNIKFYKRAITFRYLVSPGNTEGKVNYVNFESQS